jgi:hypothetical protein
MIGSDAAFSLPWSGSSMAILIEPLLVSPPPPAAALAAGAARRECQDADSRECAYLVQVHPVSSIPTVVTDLALRGQGPLRTLVALHPATVAPLPGDRTWTRCMKRMSATDPHPGSAQVAAEAMPYHSGRRPECNTGRPRPRRVASVLRSPPEERIASPGRHIGRAPIEQWSPSPARFDPSAWNTWSERPVSRTSIDSSH